MGFLPLRGIVRDTFEIETSHCLMRDLVADICEIPVDHNNTSSVVGFRR